MWIRLPKTSGGATQKMPAMRAPIVVGAPIDLLPVMY